jgi:hypothetical protein
LFLCRIVASMVRGLRLLSLATLAGLMAAVLAQYPQGYSGPYSGPVPGE